MGGVTGENLGCSSFSLEVGAEKVLKRAYPPKIPKSRAEMMMAKRMPLSIFRGGFLGLEAVREFLDARLLGVGEIRFLAAKS